MKILYKKKLAFALIGAMMLGPIACKEEFLDTVPVTGQLTEAQLATRAGLDGMLIGAYSVLNGRGTGGWFSGSTNWLWGSIRGGEANKGSNAGDFNSMSPVQRFELDPVNGEPNTKWSGSYEGIARANLFLAALAKSTDVPDADKTRMTAEARFLRGHYYFQLKITFGNVPYIDETIQTTVGAAEKVPNTTDIWPKIEEDLKFAYENLPSTQAQVGRVNKWAAGAFLGKTYVFQKKWAEAKTVLTDVINNGQTSNGKKYDLVPKFDDVFRGENENHEESVFAFQAAVGTGDVNNTNQEIAMNYPYNTGPNGPGECCGFYAPSFDLASSYRTANGLPLLDNSYRLPANELKTDQGVLSKDSFTPDAGPVDPRLDHTIGRRGIMFLDWMAHPGFDWIRDQSFAGPYTQKKYSYRKSDRGKYQDGSSWTPGYHGINFILMRFADVLLLAAEAEIEAGDLEIARGYINRIRARAANSPLLVNGAPAANYEISEYPAGWDQETARKALRFERKLELGLEGHRFFDLVRWGIAEQEINAYFAYDGAKLPTNLGGAKFTPNQDELLPIPQRQIDLQGKDVLTQNPGY